MDLLKNAVASIQLGVADYEDGTRPRLLAAVRNIHAGILLLYKEALRRLSPDGSDQVLVKAKVIPRRSENGGSIEFVGSGRKTVDALMIRERFKALDIGTDWKRFDAITQIRNDIEHYYTNVTPKGLQAVVADAFVIVRGFVATELKDDPRTLLGEATWQTMLDVNDVYQAERRECDQALASIDWHSAALEAGARDLTCSQCGSDLLRPEGDSKAYDEITLRCRACGSQEASESFVARAIQSGLAFDAYLVHTDGGDTPYVDCPECGAEAYVIEEQRCALCGHEAEHTCERCGSRIPAEELQSSPYCGWCAHMMEKDD